MNDLDKLLKLCGMKYKSGYYTAQEWKDKTGINPLGVEGIDVSHNGLCVWTDKAERMVNAHFKQVHRNWKGLGVA